jgi:tetratricopeptide (TPR) repeat protein
VHPISPTDEQQLPARYELLEVVRQYAAEQLAEAHRRGVDDQVSAYERHCHYDLTFLEQRRAQLHGGEQQRALVEIQQEIENIRSAWHWGASHGHSVAIGQAAQSLFHFYEMRSWFQEGAATFAQAAAALSDFYGATADPAIEVVRSQLLARQGWFIFHLGRHAEAQALLERELELLRQAGALDELVFWLSYLAILAAHVGDYPEAQRLCLEGLALSAAQGDRYHLAIGQTVLSQIIYRLGDYPNARRYAEEALAIDRAMGHRWGMAFSLINLGNVAYALGEYAEAQQRFQEAMAIREALEDSRGTALCLNSLGDTAAAMANHAEATRCYQSALALFQAIGNQSGAAASLNRLGYHALALGDAAGARGYFHTALRTAWDIQSTPQALDAIIGTALADTTSGQALDLAALVWSHPAATRESRDRAASLLESRGELVERDTLRRNLRPLDAIIATLLGE